MADQVAKAEDFLKKAEKKLSGWGIFGSKQEDAAELYEKAANCFKISKSWDQAGATYVKLANCHLKLDSKHEAANSFADAAHCYKKTNTKVNILRHHTPQRLYDKGTSYLKLKMPGFKEKYFGACAGYNEECGC